MGPYVIRHTRLPVTSLAAWYNHLAVQQPGGGEASSTVCFAIGLLAVLKKQFLHLRIPAPFEPYCGLKLAGGFHPSFAHILDFYSCVLWSKCNWCVSVHADVVQSLQVGQWLLSQ